MKESWTEIDIENILHHLSYRWNLESMALWKGDKVPFSPENIYEGYEDFVSVETLARIEEFKNPVTRSRLKHALIDHYLRKSLFPHETEMRTWMKGAAAHVNGEKVYFMDIIPWCQKSSTHQGRKILEKETTPLCKFLKPFALNYWNLLLDILEKDFGYDNYLEYCEEKKGIDYGYYYRLLLELLEETDKPYFEAMARWCGRRFNLSLNELTRFDAINILALSEFDSLFPTKGIDELISFFRYWGIDALNTPGLNLELGREKGKSTQGMCFILQTPDEVYVFMKPEGGWVDLETLWHELGHGFAAVFTSPERSLVETDMATSFSLSESFAFLLQGTALSVPFLRDFLGMGGEDAGMLSYYKALRDLSVFRRYAAKFLVEYEMFSNGDLSSGKRYSELMSRYTGFYYQPESHLFDLAPEFYSLDYILGWMAEAIMERYLRTHMGENWIYLEETGEVLKRWWAQGNRWGIHRFLEENELGTLSPQALLRRWEENLGTY